LGRGTWQIIPTNIGLRAGPSVPGVRRFSAVHSKSKHCANDARAARADQHFDRYLVPTANFRTFLRFSRDKFGRAAKCAGWLEITIVDCKKSTGDGRFFSSFRRRGSRRKDGNGDQSGTARNAKDAKSRQ
jgi:hypothetical protein